MILRAPFFLILAAVFLNSCRSGGDGSSAPDAGAEIVEKRKPKPALKREQVVGRVASVDSDARFVLVELFVHRDKASEGALLKAYGDGGRTSRLKFSGETMGSFAVADILTGRVEKGDGVRFLVQADTPGFFGDDEVPVGDEVLVGDEDSADVPLENGDPTETPNDE